MASINTNSLTNRSPGPAWEIAELFPEQGELSESDYLLLTDRTNRLAEFVDGKIEVLAMPTDEHQEIVLFLVNLLRAFAMKMKVGRALMAPLRVKVADGRFREPDVVFVMQPPAKRVNRFWSGADLVMEVVSEDDPDRDWVAKRRDYAKARVPEYWIVDPQTLTITVLTLAVRSYKVHGVFKPSETATSKLLKGFEVAVADVFAAGEAKD